MELINTLPEDLVNEIYQYLNYEILYKTNLSYFNEFYIDHLKNMLFFEKGTKLNIRKTKCYFDKIFEKDNLFIFNHAFKFCFPYFQKIKKWKFKNKIYPTFLFFIEERTIKFNSHSCRKSIKDIYHENEYTKKRHKKIKIKSNRWSN
tara:strand:+ start:40 stop:480 length:441 start_codon:yes stop_codon:yes gene_type:complete